MASGSGGKDAEGGCGCHDKFSEESDGCLASLVSDTKDVRD